jgi:hypothetical protein
MVASPSWVVVLALTVLASTCGHAAPARRDDHDLLHSGAAHDGDTRHTGSLPQVGAAPGPVLSAYPSVLTDGGGESIEISWTTTDQFTPKVCSCNVFPLFRPLSQRHASWRHGGTVTEAHAASARLPVLPSFLPSCSWGVYGIQRGVEGGRDAVEVRLLAPPSSTDSHAHSQCRGGCTRCRMETGSW